MARPLRLMYLMLVIAALQFSWNAVTAYCMHETGRAAHHLGHHPHPDEADAGASLLKHQPSAAKKTSVHAHCASCSHAVSSLDGLDARPVYPQLAGTAPVATVMTLSSSFTIPPDRPQWLAAV